MSEPIVFISRNRVKEGKLDGFREYSREVARRLEKELPGTVATNFYLNEQGSEAINVFVFSDANAMERHVQAAREFGPPAYQFVEALGLEVYGPATDRVLEMMRGIAGSGVALSVFPERLSGYIRLKSN